MAIDTAFSPNVTSPVDTAPSTIKFYCQKCKTPIDPKSMSAVSKAVSLTKEMPMEQVHRAGSPVPSRPTSANLSVEQINVMAKSGHHRSRSTSSSSSVTQTKARRQGKGPTADVDSFILLPLEEPLATPHGQDVAPFAPFRMDSYSQLSSILRGEKDRITTPLCTVCVGVFSDTLLSMISEKKETNLLYGQCRAMLRDWAMDGEALDVAVAEKGTWAEGERKLTLHIKDAVEEIRRLNETLHQLDQKEKTLAESEEHHWQDVNQHQALVHEAQQDAAAANVQHDHQLRQLDRLQRTSILHHAFRIVLQEQIVWTLRESQIQWSDVNAAWGFAVLLCDILAQQMHYTFKSARLEARSSNSRIHVVSPTDGTITAYDLFGAGDSSLGRLFYNRKFDTGMVAFLALIQELGTQANTVDPAASLPHKCLPTVHLGPNKRTHREGKNSIKKDKIGDISIKLHYSNDENWTLGCRHILANLQYLQQWSAAH